MKLSLRDLFWLVLVVGMGCAWWVDRRRWRAEVDKLRLEVTITKMEFYVRQFD